MEKRVISSVVIPDLLNRSRPDVAKKPYNLKDHKFYSLYHKDVVKVPNWDWGGWMV